MHLEIRACALSGALVPSPWRASRASVRSDTGPEFTAQVVRDWLKLIGMKTLFIEPWSPRGNWYFESFSRKLRDELLNNGFFQTLWEERVPVVRWRRHHNTV